MILEIIIEKGDKEIWGRIEGIGHFLPVSVGKTKQELVANLELLIQDYMLHEGKSDKAWLKYQAKRKYVFSYDLQSFFADHDYLNQTKIAMRTGINPGLIRHYISGVKYPSLAQTLKIQKVIHALAKELSSVNFY